MKILLLTDMPPCKNFTAGLVILQLLKFLPRGSVACYAVVNAQVDAKLDPEFQNVPIRYAVKPREAGLRLLHWKFGFFTSLVSEMFMHFIKVPKIADDVKEFAKQFGADKIWCILQGQTMFRLAVDVSKRLNLPLHTQVWDPPGWWLRANSVDFLSRKVIMKTFDKAMRLSRTCAAASWAMADRYNDLYSCNAIPVIPSLESSWAVPPAKRIHDRDYIIIGLAGQLYAQAEWLNLLLALDKVNWNIAGKKIIIRLLGRSISISASSGQNIEFLGWHNQQDTIRLLSEADILYCPYWSDPVFEEEARYSFPSKLTTFLAAGRPVFFHGPEYASPSRFLKMHDAAIFCHDLSRSNIYNCIERLIRDNELYERLAFNGNNAFKNYLTTDIMRQQFAKFLEVESLEYENVISEVEAKTENQDNFIPQYNA